MKNLFAAVVFNLLVLINVAFDVWMSIQTENAGGFTSLWVVVPAWWWLISSINRYRNAAKDHSYE